MRIEPTFFALQCEPSSPFILEDVRAAGRQLQIRVLGLVTIADDVTPELALATIESVEVLGALRASPAVKTALRDRIR